MGRFLSEKETDTMMALVDADGSGTIDYEEFIVHFFGIIQKAKEEEAKEEEAKQDDDKKEDANGEAAVTAEEKDTDEKVKDDKKD